MAEEERAFKPRTGICALSRAVQGTEAEIAAPGLGGISMLESAGRDAERQMAEEIMTCAITYFEARNFQDITGQHT